MRRIAILIAFIFATQINSGSAQNKISNNKLLNAYYQLKNSLATDNSTSAAKDARVLVAQVSTAQLEKLPNSKLALDEQSTIVKSAATYISATTDIAKQRELFGKLSDAMVLIVKNSKAGDSPIFLQYCPMAKQGWLNEKKEIENPYYGKSMFECGTVKEVLNNN